jgi:hypothetical protein
LATPIDLAEVGLPLLDEPNHPRLQQYSHQHTKDWSAAVSRADAFVLVTPEYNHSFPASLKNALDHLVRDRADKPAGIVSYGGVSILHAVPDRRRRLRPQPQAGGRRQGDGRRARPADPRVAAAAHRRLTAGRRDRHAVASTTGTSAGTLMSAPPP